MNKYLFVVASLRGGGSERLTLELANNACKLGYDVTLFIGAFEGPYINEVSPDVTIFKGAGKRFSRSLPSLVRLLHDVSFNKVFCSQEYVIAITYLARFFAFKSKSMSILAREASTPSKNILPGFKNAILKHLYRFCYERVDKLIAPTKAVKEDIIEFYNLKRKIEVISNPVDVSKIRELSMKAPSLIPQLSTKDYVVAVGRLIESKGVQHIIEALYLSNLKNVSLVLLGIGEYKDELVNVSKRFGLEDRVIFLGFQSNPFPIVSNASLFIMASKYEGMPNALIQASILKVPCVSTLNSGTVAEIVSPEFIFNYSDVSSLANILQRIFLSKEKPVNLKCDFNTPKSFISKIFS